MTSDSTSGIIRRITSFVSDTNLLVLGSCGQGCRGFVADNDGNVALVDMSDTTVTVPVLKGNIMPIRAKTIKASGSGTSVSGLTILY